MKYKLALGCGMVVGLIVFVGAMAVIFGIVNHNKMVRLEEGVKEKWNQVENMYQQRLDLIPTLVETVRGYADDEKETLQAVTEAGEKARGTLSVPGQALNSPRLFRQFQQAQDTLSAALRRLMKVVETRPELKTNRNLLALQDQLEEIENRLTSQRQGFNDAAGKYNTYIRKFPQAIIANMSGFKKKPVLRPGKTQKRRLNVKGNQNE